jgi:hypothetical protein
MAQKTREELNAANAALFVNNSTGDITPELEKAFNADWIDSTATLSDDNNFTGVNNHIKEVRWHKGANLASASTLALGTTGNYHHITGDTTIEFLSVKPHGTRMLLYFTESLVLNGNAFFLMPNNNANVSVQAGSTAEFVSEGNAGGTGVWRMIQYLPSNSSVLQTFDVNITDTAAIRGLNTEYIPLVADDGVSYLQLIAATILMNDDGTTNYDFTGYMSIIGTGDSNVKAFSAAMDVSIGSGTTSVSTLPINLPSTNNLFLTFKTAINEGGLALSAFSDATEGNRTLRVYGTYVKFPIS